MKGRNIKEKEGSAIVSYIRSSYIAPNWKDMRCIADITKLSEIAVYKLKRGRNND